MLSLSSTPTEKEKGKKRKLNIFARLAEGKGTGCERLAAAGGWHACVTVAWRVDSFQGESWEQLPSGHGTYVLLG